MTLPTFLEPAHARITIPVVLAVGYALYHWWRWRMMHPKIVIEELPEPASEATTVSKPSSPQPNPEKSEETAMKPAGSPSPAKPKPADDRPQPRREFSRWQLRREQELAEAQFDFEAYDADFHRRAFHKAYGGRPEYFVRLGEYAWRRGAMVETHFWVSMAKFHGVEGLDEWIGVIRRRWIQSGRPLEQNNVYDQYPFERGALAYAYLMAACGFGVAVNHDCIVKMAYGGDEDALLISKNM